MVRGVQPLLGPLLEQPHAGVVVGVEGRHAQGAHAIGQGVVHVGPGRGERPQHVLVVVTDREDRGVKPPAERACPSPTPTPALQAPVADARLGLRQVEVRVVVAVAEPAAVHHHRVAEHRAGSVGRLPQALVQMGAAVCALNGR